MVADIEVGRIQPEVGKPGVIQWPVGEFCDDLVEVLADPGHAGSADAVVIAEGFDDLVDFAGGDPVDPGLADHRVEGFVDAFTGVEQGGENDPFRIFGIARSSSPAGVATVVGRVPLRVVVRSWLRS